MKINHSKVDKIVVSGISTLEERNEIKVKALESGFSVVSTDVDRNGFKIIIEREQVSDTMPIKWLDFILTKYLKNT